jgi:predicted metal-binding membrane protein
MSAFRIAVPALTGRIAVTGAVSLLAVAAWVVLWSADQQVHGVLHFQGRTETGAPFGLSTMLIFVAAWTVMSLAMMLPTSLPVLTALHTFARDRTDRPLLITLAAFGYLLAWIAAGAIVGPVSLALQSMVASPVAPRLPDQVVASALLLVAGLFQFSALKYRCLEKCRSPLHFVLSYWRGRGQHWPSFRLGWASGVFCVGCCWALMLLMLLSSLGHLAWMLLLGLVMALEKNARWGRRLSAPLGIGLIVCAAVVLIAGGENGLFARMFPEICGIK